MIAYGEIKLTEVEGGTEMLWAMEMDMPFMMRGMSLFMDMDAAGVDFEEGIDGLNEYLAGMEVAPAVTGSEVMTDDMWVISVTDTVTMEELMAPSGNAHERMFGELGMVLGMTGAEMAGQPMAVWHSYPDPIVMEACFPVMDSVAIPEDSRAVCRMIPGHKAIMSSFYGWYDGLDQHNADLQAWIQENGYTVAGAPWDLYHDFEEPLVDTMSVRTDVYVPVN